MSLARFNMPRIAIGGCNYRSIYDSEGFVVVAAISVPYHRAERYPSDMHGCFFIVVSVTADF